MLWGTVEPSVVSPVLRGLCCGCVVVHACERVPLNISNVEVEKKQEKKTRKTNMKHSGILVVHCIKTAASHNDKIIKVVKNF